MLGKLDFYMLNPFCSTNVYGLATLNTPKEKILILGLVWGERDRVTMTLC